MLHWRRNRLPRHEKSAGQQRQDDGRGGGNQPRRQTPYQRQRRAVRVEAIERGNELRGGLEARRGVGLEQARDDPIECLRNLRLHRAQGRRALGDAALQLLDRAEVAAATMQADQHVGHDQPERVHVGALIGRLAFGLFGRHVGDGADDAARLGVGCVPDSAHAGRERSVD